MTMSERDEAVMRAFPDLFGPGPWDPHTTAMAYGLVIQEGWRPLLFDLLDELRLIAQEDGTPLRIEQVKQKLGGLRVYVSAHARVRERVHAAIRQAEARAAQTCEFCGHPGRLRTTRPYIATLCDRCDQAEERGQRR